LLKINFDPDRKGYRILLILTIFMSTIKYINDFLIYVNVFINLYINFIFCKRLKIYYSWYPLNLPLPLAIQFASAANGLNESYARLLRRFNCTEISTRHNEEAHIREGRGEEGKHIVKFAQPIRPTAIALQSTV